MLNKLFKDNYLYFEMLIVYVYCCRFVFCIFYYFGEWFFLKFKIILIKNSIICNKSFYMNKRGLIFR